MGRIFLSKELFLEFHELLDELHAYCGFYHPGKDIITTTEAIRVLKNAIPDIRRYEVKRPSVGAIRIADFRLRAVKLFDLISEWEESMMREAKEKQSREMSSPEG